MPTHGVYFIDNHFVSSSFRRQFISSSTIISSTNISSTVTSLMYYTNDKWGNDGDDDKYCQWLCVDQANGIFFSRHIKLSHIYTCKLISILILSIPFGIYNIEFLNYKQCEQKMKNVVQPKLKDLSCYCVFLWGRVG